MVARRFRRGSILLTSIVLMTVAGVSTTAWLGYVTEATRGAHQDRARTHALYAAEAGVEAIVDFFNNPANFKGQEPAEYTHGAQPTNYPIQHPNIVPSWYKLFEPYIFTYLRDSSNNPVYNNGQLMGVQRTFFRNLAAGSNVAVSQTSKIPTCVLDLSQNPELIFRDDNGAEISRVLSITLINPADIDWAAENIPSDVRVITVVQSVGITPGGVEVNLQSVITENETFALTSPGPIISRASVSYNGNFNVAWGEVWAAANVELPSNWTNKVSRQNQDKWFSFRTQGVFLNHQGNRYADGKVQGGFSTTAITSSQSNYFQPFRQADLHERNTGTGANGFTGYDNMYQHQQLRFPDYDYNKWKEFIQLGGYPYFFTDSTGKVYGRETNPSSSNFGLIVGKSYDDWFGISPTDPNYSDQQQMVAFIDSIPTNAAGQEAPKDERGIPIINDQFFPRNPSGLNGDPAARMATITLAGGSLHTRGAIFVAGNMDMRGQGNPPQSTSIPGVTKPDGTSPDSSFRIFHNGFLYCYGEVSGGGNRTIYGSIYAERGYSGNGDPQVYYNVRLSDGSWLNLNQSRVRRSLWSFTTTAAMVGG